MRGITLARVLLPLGSLMLGILFSSPAAAGPPDASRREELLGWSPDGSRYVTHVARKTAEGSRELTLLVDLKAAAPPVTLCSAPRCASTLKDAAPLAARKGTRLVAAVSPAPGWSPQVTTVDGRLQFALGRAGGGGGSELVLGYDTALFSATYRVLGVSWAPGRKLVALKVERTERREDGSVLVEVSYFPFAVKLPTSSAPR